MAVNKTVPTDEEVAHFLDTVEPAIRRQEADEMITIMQRASGESPRMWGKSIVGFGSYRYRYASGREGEWMLTGFSPRKSALSVYIMNGFSSYESLLDKLGRPKTGKSCLYIKALMGVDTKVLETLISRSVGDMRKKYAVEAD